MMISNKVPSPITMIVLSDGVNANGKQSFWKDDVGASPCGFESHSLRGVVAWDAAPSARGSRAKGNHRVRSLYGTAMRASRCVLKRRIGGVVAPGGVRFPATPPTQGLWNGRNPAANTASPMHSRSPAVPNVTHVAKTHAAQTNNTTATMVHITCHVSVM